MRLMILLPFLAPCSALAQNVYSQDAHAAAAYFTHAAKKLPTVVASKSAAISSEGIGVFLTDRKDPAVEELTVSVVKGFQHLSEALRKDMVAVVQRSNRTR